MSNWHAGRIVRALVRHYDWRANKMMTEFLLDRGQCDLLMVSKAGYATEFEVKVRLSDWNADRQKDKWRHERPHICRFFYAVPQPLSERVPDWLPDWAGVLAVHDGQHGHDFVREVRPARRRPSRKLPEGYLRSLTDNCYYRYWHQQVRLLDKQRLCA